VAPKISRYRIINQLYEIFSSKLNVKVTPYYEKLVLNIHFTTHYVTSLSLTTLLEAALYIANVLPLQWVQLTETVHTARLGHEFVFVFFGLHDLSLCLCVFCFTVVS